MQITAMILWQSAPFLAQTRAMGGLLWSECSQRLRQEVLHPGHLLKQFIFIPVTCPATFPNLGACSFCWRLRLWSDLSCLT